ncbi:zinc finger matrin-type protein 4 [Drosophila takahashii]|uniref:zinc finger matrin-type protein 4 n=1 Tax=Drosophila takahashii TaxID=29030 RepID=UPI001CF82C1B|nr:zinc finger protein 346 [Drosophila takahashii]
MSSPGFLSNFHIPHLAPGAAPPSEPMDRSRNQSPPAPEIPTGNRLVAPGKQVGNSGDSPAMRPPLKRKAERMEEDPSPELALFPGRDESYPEELNRLIGPLNCELCKVQVTSRKCARDHYESKAHDRHISAWLAKNYTEAGLEAPQVKRMAKQGPTGPNAFYCDLCDLDLTSSMHARQHYLGRKHKLVEQRISKPSGAGHYDAAGKWVRTSSKFEGEGSSSNPPDGRHGIGSLFLKAEEVVASKEMEVATQESPNDKEQRSCSLCKIVVTSAPQMQIHLAGARHQKNLKAAAGQDQPVASGDTASLPEAPPQKLEKLDAAELALYRTPIGQYYCQPCNMMMNHVTTLQQHLIGKKHQKTAKNLPQAEKTA